MRGQGCSRHVHTWEAVPLFACCLVLRRKRQQGTGSRALGTPGLCASGRFLKPERQMRRTPATICPLWSALRSSCRQAALVRALRLALPTPPAASLHACSLLLVALVALFCGALAGPYIPASSRGVAPAETRLPA